MKFSIDKISLLFPSDFLKADFQKDTETKMVLLIDYVLNELKTLNLIEHDYNGADGFAYHFKLRGDVDFQFLPKFPVKKVAKFEDEETGEEWKQSYFVSSSYLFRFEFNPNNTSMKEIAYFVHGLIAYFSIDTTQIKITRTDYAVDYFFQLNPFLIRCSKIRKLNLHIDVNKGVQTIYFGTKGSKYFFRIYDKKAQLKSEGIECEYDHYWRIELCDKREFNIEAFDEVNEYENLFNLLEFYNHIGTSGKHVLDLVLFKAQYVGIDAALLGFDPKTKKDYLSILDKLTFIEGEKFKHPGKIFDEEFWDTWRSFKNDFMRVMTYEKITD